MPEPYKAQEEDVLKVRHILVTAAQWLSSQGMDHWLPWHSEERVRHRIKTKEVYLLTDDIGTITLSDRAPFYYKPDDDAFFQEPAAPALYISGLAVLPSHHGQGLASRLLSFAEETAIDRGISFIRFDAVAYYQKLTKFYVDRGYTLVGNRIAGKEESNFFEKHLKS